VGKQVLLLNGTVLTYTSHLGREKKRAEGARGEGQEAEDDQAGQKLGEGMAEQEG